MNEIKVMIIDDETFFLQLLRNAVNTIEGFTVCSTAHDARTAAAGIPGSKPDIIILGGSFHGSEGVHFLKRIIPQYAVPMIVCVNDGQSVKSLLEAGAADIVTIHRQSDMPEIRQTLCHAMKNALNLREVVCMGKTYRLRRTGSSAKSADDRLIVIGGSAGSTEVLPHILRGLPQQCPPIAVTLHMPEGYTELYVKRLNDDPGIKIKIIEAVGETDIKPGNCVIARGAQHLRVIRTASGYIAESKPGERISGHCPSVDALFESAARIAESSGGGRIIGVILTGMGSDGAQGLLKLKKAGGYTIGQDEKTSMVYGMPRAAYECGAVERQRGQMLIAAEIMDKLKEWKR